MKQYRGRHETHPEELAYLLQQFLLSVQYLPVPHTVNWGLGPSLFFTPLSGQRELIPHWQYVVHLFLSIGVVSPALQVALVRMLSSASPFPTLIPAFATSLDGRKTHWASHISLLFVLILTPLQARCPPLCPRSLCCSLKCFQTLTNIPNGWRRVTE